MAENSILIDEEEVKKKPPPTTPVCERPTQLPVLRRDHHPEPKLRMFTIRFIQFIWKFYSIVTVREFHYKL